jgi:hypothetical protein
MSAMRDESVSHGVQHRASIHINQANELRYWTKEFNVTEAQLRDAVNKAGVSAVAVRAYLARS